MRYKQVYHNEWVRPKRRGYKLACCDCGLVHVLDFKLESYGSGKRIVFRARRYNRATAQVRRSKRFEQWLNSQTTAKVRKPKRPAHV